MNGTAYGAAKGGIVQLTRHMAESWSPHGINCNAIAPGFFPTPAAPIYAARERVAMLAKQTAVRPQRRASGAQGRRGVFLCSPASDYITGQTLPVDGGFTAK